MSASVCAFFCVYIYLINVQTFKILVSAIENAIMVNHQLCQFKKNKF